jgi:hypothetical protein
MKKKLLFVALAVMTAATSFAAQYEVNSYAFSQTQRFKITGENLVTNGNFANGLDGWFGNDQDTAPSAEVWDIAAEESKNAGPNGENVVTVLSTTTESPLTNVWTLGAGTYIVSFDAKFPAAGNTSVTVGNADYLDFFLNTDGAITKVASTEEAPVINVAALSYHPAEEWKTFIFYFTADSEQKLVMNFNNVTAGTQITNIAIQAAEEVYDVRVAQRRIDFVKSLMEMPEFNVDAAQDAKANLQGLIETVEAMLADGSMDDATDAEGTMLSFEEEGVAPFMSITSRRMNDKLAGTDNVTSLATIGRGGKLPATYANLDLVGGNWGHPASADYLMSAIQSSYANNATYSVFNTNFPKGRYLFTAEIRNANTGKDSWPCTPTFNLESICKVFVGTDSVDTEAIVGEDYQRILHVADIAEDGQFRAGVYWPGTSTGGAFFIKNVEVYALGDAQQIETDINHIEAWVAFKAQWDAANNNRLNLVNKIDNPNYPWEQDSVKTARATWDPYFYDNVWNKGWVTADGKDGGVATTEELAEWATHQGFYPTVGEGEDSTFYRRYVQYALVRGYQDATNWIVAANKPFTDLGNAIEAAKKTRNNGANLTGDRDAYKTAILAALNTLTTVRSTTTDATREADTATLTKALEDLNAATEAFLATVSVKPFVDIDFSNGFAANDNEEISEAYYIAGTQGRMYFTGYGEDNNASTDFALGVGEEYMDVLRVGNGKATVYLSESEQPTESEAIRFTFDFFHGNLNGKNAGVELQNAAGERVAGFSLNRYNGSLAYNDFNDAGKKGLDILAYATGVGSSSASNAAIAADNNRTSYELVVDYLNKTLKGTIVNPQKGTCDGAAVPFRTDIEDQKVVKFVLISNYNNKDRRCWFDNLKISKYALTAVEEDITDATWAPFEEITSGIKNVANAAADNAVYTLSGVRVTSAAKPGLYIRNGKKFVVK